MTHLSVGCLEGQRQAYLAAMGIPLWTVRADSSLKEQSVPLHFVASQTQSNLVKDVEPTQALQQTPQASKLPPVKNHQSQTVHTEPPVFDDPPLDVYLNDPEYQKAEDFQAFVKARAALVPDVKPQTIIIQKQPTAEGQPIHFRFALYGCGVWQLIVPRSQLLSPSEITLLANIQRVMQSEIASPLLFVWPMVNNYAIARHKKAAQEALVSFFNNQALSDNGYIVLSDFEDELVELLQQSTPKPVIKQASLATLLQQPLKKKDLWLALNQ